MNGVGRVNEKHLSWEFWPIKCQCCPRIETNQLISTANQLTGFYMRATLTLKEGDKDGAYFKIRKLIYGLRFNSASGKVTFLVQKFPDRERVPS